MYLVLASKSPRRKEILTNAGFKFKISVSDVDETVYEIYPEDRVLAIARKKGEAVYKKFINDDKAVILSADTIVVINGEILGKPKDKYDARRMIESLQGRTHNVYTAVYIKSKDYEKQFLEKTEVMVSNMTPEEIEEYINTSEPYDKAGGYAIQGIFGKYIKSINGDYFNVMGLPINKVKEALSIYEFNDKIVCPNCNNIVKETDKFCLKCGTKLFNYSSNTNDVNECPICHHINEKDSEYCQTCGSLLNLNEQARDNINESLNQKKDYSKIAFIMALISIGVYFLISPIFTFPFSILTIIFSLISLKRGNREKTIISLLTGIIILVLSVLTILKLLSILNIIIEGFSN